MKYVIKEENRNIGGKEKKGNEEKEKGYRRPIACHDFASLVWILDLWS